MISEVSLQCGYKKYSSGFHTVLKDKDSMISEVSLQCE